MTTVDTHLHPLSALDDLVDHWRRQRDDRLQRDALDPADIAELRHTGLFDLVLRSPVRTFGPGSQHPEVLTATVRDVAAALQRVGRVDPSVALVASMHPAVLSFWLVDGDDGDAARRQRDAVRQTATRGDQWGTLTSEPGSGGDIARTAATARHEPLDHALPGETYVLSGAKHFGSGLGVVDWMVTTAVPEGEREPALFVIDVRGLPWDGTAGLRLRRAWDGIGMKATQSHAMTLEAMPAVRFAGRTALGDLAGAVNPFVLTLFAAVVVGIVEEARDVTRTLLADRQDGLRAAELVSWVAADRDTWMCAQGLEGMVRAVEAAGPDALLEAVRGKHGIATLAEDVLRELARAVGGQALSASSPLSHWTADVRALGFLRPPWGLMVQQHADLSLHVSG